MQRHEHRIRCSNPQIPRKHAQTVDNFHLQYRLRCSVYKERGVHNSWDMECIRTIAGLAQSLGKSEKDLQLHCNFCKRLLTACEKIIFSKYRFRLRWQKGHVYACCRQCMRLSGQIEFKGYFEKNIPVQEWFASGGGALQQQIRCKCCLKPLTRGEKNRLRNTREFIYLVRGSLRGICTLCRLLNNAQ